MDSSQFKKGIKYPTKGGGSTELFLGGPIPMWWLKQAAMLKGYALEVGIKLWFMYKLNKGRPFKISNSDATLYGHSPDSGRRGLALLTKAGLIKLKRKNGHKSVVTIIADFDSDMTRPSPTPPNESNVPPVNPIQCYGQNRRAHE